MTRKQAIDKARLKAKKEAKANDYGDSMVFVVWDDEYICYIVLSENMYDRFLGSGDIDQAVASIWSDGISVEVTQ